jgi:DNA-binding MarR family transcriptional regulator
MSELSARQGEIMDILGGPEYRKQPVATASSLSEQMVISRAAVVRVLAALVGLNLVQRVRWRGTNRYELTGHGLAVQSNRESSRRWNEMRSGA